MPNTEIHKDLLSLLVTGTSITCGRVKLILWFIRYVVSSYTCNNNFSWKLLRIVKKKKIRNHKISTTGLVQFVATTYNSILIVISRNELLVHLL